METITFYSYKGGVGRTLALANVARYLSWFGKNVFCLDFDLEAPGLHYKLLRSPGKQPVEINVGAIDYIYSFAVDGEVPKNLGDYVIPVEEGRQGGEGWIKLMPAGNCPSSTYWRKLSRINWHELFYGSSCKPTGADADTAAHLPPGVPFFLDLKDKIESEYTPDVLLIDSRTGITEIGGVATTLLPDKLVCLIINNRENLEGAREVLRNIKALSAADASNQIEIVPVLTRVPLRSPIFNDKMKEKAISATIADIKTFFNEEAQILENTLNIGDIFILHSEPALEIEETIHIGDDSTSEMSTLLNDYLKLFGYLIPDGYIKENINSLIQSFFDTIRNHHDFGQYKIEAYWTYRKLPEIYDALMEYYALRTIVGFKPVKAAIEHWKANKQCDPNDKEVADVVLKHKNMIFDSEQTPLFSKFINDIVRIWCDTNGEDTDFDHQIIDYYFKHNNLDTAADFLCKRWDRDGWQKDEYLWYAFHLHCVDNIFHLEILSKKFIRWAIRIWFESGQKDAEFYTWLLYTTKAGIKKDSDYVLSFSDVLNAEHEQTYCINDMPEIEIAVDHLIHMNNHKEAALLLTKFSERPFSNKQYYMKSWARLILAMDLSKETYEYARNKDITYLNDLDDSVLRGKAKERIHLLHKTYRNQYEDIDLDEDPF